MQICRIGDFCVSIEQRLLADHEDLGRRIEAFLWDPAAFACHADVSAPFHEEQADIILRQSLVDSVPEVPADGAKLLYRFTDCHTPILVYEFTDGTYEFRFLSYEDQVHRVFRIRKDWSDICLIWEADHETEFFLNVGALFSIAVLAKDACVFHGVVMDYHGQGVLVMAHSGVGKTTHTSHWERAEIATILNGDRCLCRRIDGVWYAYGMPWCGSSERAMPNRRVPVRVLVKLERGTINETEALSPFDAELFLLQRIYAPVTAGELQDHAFEYVHDLQEKSNVMTFRCTKDASSMEVLRAEVDRCIL